MRAEAQRGHEVPGGLNSLPDCGLGPALGRAHTPFARSETGRPGACLERPGASGRPARPAGSVRRSNKSLGYPLPSAARSGTVQINWSLSLRDWLRRTSRDVVPRLSDVRGITCRWRYATRALAAGLPGPSRQGSLPQARRRSCGVFRVARIRTPGPRAIGSPITALSRSTSLERPR